MESGRKRGGEGGGGDQRDKRDREMERWICGRGVWLMEKRISSLLYKPENHWHYFENRLYFFKNYAREQGFNYRNATNWYSVTIDHILQKTV